MGDAARAPAPLNQTPDFLIVGAGIYGATAALELHARGHRVSLIDPGGSATIPHPLAASTDISKVVRMEYGTDDDYMTIVDEAIDGWQRWNEELGEVLYHETGVTMLTRGNLAPGGFEYESYQRLLAHGHRPERLDADTIARRFPAWNEDAYADGFFHARGGFAESGRVVAALVGRGRDLGVDIGPGRTAIELVQGGGRVTAVKTRESGSRQTGSRQTGSRQTGSRQTGSRQTGSRQTGSRQTGSRQTGSRQTGSRQTETLTAGHVIVCAGAWTPYLLPELRPVMRSSGHPVFHLKTPDAALFTPPAFAVFTADVANTGWYGFPLHPRAGVVKIANHGVGREVHPERDERVVTAEDEAELRRFLSGTFPALAAAPIVYTRRCLYCDTLDEHLWIDRHPEVDGLTVAAGGSGHAFKMAPVLGGLIADAAEGRPNRWLPKFRWRQLAGETAGEEAARFHG